MKKKVVLHWTLLHKSSGKNGHHVLIGCHGIEAFFEKNRTGYPATSPVYSDDPNYIPGQLVIVKNSVLAAGQVPKRFVFPYTETTINNNSPALVPITTPVWWGKQ